MRKRSIACTLAASLVLGLCPVSGAVPGAAALAEEPKEVAQIEAEEGREKLNFNQGWKFVRQNIPEAIEVDYDMSQLERWENVNLPHTVREESFNNSGNKNYQGPAMYRKHFYLSESYAEKKLYIEFEAAMGVTDVWVNGEHLQSKMAAKTGENTQYGGYLPFVLDVTDYVHCDGEKNVITVLTDNSDNTTVPPGKPQGQLDFTYFGGLYRNAWLHSMNPVHITDEAFEDVVAGGGILVDYPEVSKERAVAAVTTQVRNETTEEKTMTLVSDIVDRTGTSVGKKETEVTVPAGEALEIEQTIEVENPKLWDLDDPYLHTLVSTILMDGKEIDEVETSIGIRRITMSPETGLSINGEHPGFLSGVNRHQEYAYIGYAGSDALQRRDALKYKSAGFNIVRTAHHPQSEAFLQACDEVGILVIEAIPGWQHWSSAPEFAARVKNDTQQMIRRDRNHPCILSFEISLNESPGVPQGFTNEVEALAKKEHPSLVTSAENPHNGAAGDILYGTPEEVASWSDTALSLIREYGDFWEEQFGRFGDSCRVTRGTSDFYPGGEARMVMQANNRLWNGYNFNGTGSISLSEGIQNYENSNHRFAGVTMWIGIDHNRGYHETMSPCGIWDLMRIPKYSYYAFESQRSVERNEYLESLDVTTGPMLFVASSWSEHAPVVDKSNGETLGTDAEREIYIYSNAEKVTLSVVGSDGEVLWSQEQEPMDTGTAGLLNHPPFYFESVPYTAGSYLKAEGFDAEGKVIAEQEVHTAGEPAAIRLEVDDTGEMMTADGSDKVMVYATVVDENGNVCQEADNLLKFSVEGDARIVGDGDQRVGANPVKAEAGVTGIFVEAGKKAEPITITVKGEGLETASVEIAVKALEDKCVPYEEIAQGAPMNEASMYLTNKAETIPGEDAPSVQKGTVSVGGQDYANSMEVKNMTPVRFDLKGAYERLTGKVGVKNPEATASGVVFKVYGDGALLYRSEPVEDGVAEIDVDIAGTKKLTLIAECEGEKNDMIPCWLSPYITEGKGVTDESELRENLALGKTAAATSIDEGTDASDAIDGDILSLWRSANQVTEENSETLTVDLGKPYDIRNARIAVEFDYLRCTYTISTSKDGKDWKEQSTTSKTAHGNAELDVFTAEDVRYVKVEFTKVESTQGTSGGGEPKASVKELEIYRDKGVETVRDYNLAGLSVAGADIVFDAGTTAYEITKKTPGKTCWVKAFPANPNSVATINGTEIYTGVAESLEDISYMEVTPNEENQIVIEVTSPDGKGSKQYVISVKEAEETEKSDAQDSFVSGVNGANGWSYQAMDRNTGEITTLDNSTGGYIQGEYAWFGGSGWLYAGPRYTHPAADRNAVRTFTVEQEGNLQLQAKVQKYTGQWGAVNVWVQKNGEKIWPVNEAHMTLEEGGTLNIRTRCTVTKGDQIHIIVDSQGDNAGDGTFMKSSVEYVTPSEPDERTSYLSDLEWESAYAGDGSVNRDASSSGQMITLTDENNQPVIYEKGLGTHAESEIVYDIKDAGYVRFQSFVGVDYTQNPDGFHANVVFKVYLNDKNGEPVYDSGEMVYDTPQKFIDLELDETVEKLILVVEKGENNWSDHADWADAKLLKPEPGHVHEMTHVAAKEATCMESGNVEYWHCESCEKNFADEAGKEALEEVEIPAPGHGWSEEYSHNETHHWFACVRCDAKKDEAEHTGGTATPDKKAICEVCGAEYGEILPEDLQAAIQEAKDAAAKAETAKTKAEQALADAKAQVTEATEKAEAAKEEADKAATEAAAAELKAQEAKTAQEKAAAAAKQAVENAGDSEEDRQAAEDAKDAAEKARGEAEKAKGEAETAKREAETARGAAVDAQEAATDAQEAAEAAQEEAGKAAKAAEDAAQAAAQSEDNAIEAKEKAEEAQTQAEAAQKAAEADAAEAKNANAEAGKAQVEAEAAAGKAEAAQQLAEGHANVANAAAKEAKAYAQKAEAAKKAAEEAAKRAEEERKKVEEELKKIQEEAEKKLAEMRELLEETAKAALQNNSDFRAGSWYEDYVVDVYLRGYMTGMNADYFGINETLVRAQFAVILYRMAGEPEVEFKDTFADVKDGQFYSDAVTWASKEGIITGYEDSGLFGANDKITREQMATIMYRYADVEAKDEKKEADADTDEILKDFPDAEEVSEFAKEALAWCVEEEIITGKTAGEEQLLAPQGSALRAECAAIISRFAAWKEAK